MLATLADETISAFIQFPWLCAWICSRLAQVYLVVSGVKVILISSDCLCLGRYLPSATADGCDSPSQGWGGWRGYTATGRWRTRCLRFGIYCLLVAQPVSCEGLAWWNLAVGEALWLPQPKFPASSFCGGPRWFWIHMLLSHWLQVWAPLNVYTSDMYSITHTCCLWLRWLLASDRYLS